MKAERIIGPAPTRSRTARVMDEVTTFWAGFTTPSRFALLLTLAMFSLTVLATLIFITPATLAGPLGDYIPRNTADGDGFATIEALRLAQPNAAAGKEPRLYIIGNSITAHSFAAEDGIEQHLKAITRKDWSVHILSTPLQGSLDEAALADFATRQRSGVVVLSPGFGRFGAQRDNYFYMYRLGRLGFQSDWKDEQLRMIGGIPRRQTGIYAIDNRRFLMRNAGMAALRVLTGQPAKRRLDIWDERRLLGDPTYRPGVLAMLKASEKQDPLAIKMLADTTRRLHERGNIILFFEAPVSPGLLTNPADLQTYDRYLIRSRQLADRFGDYYCRPPANAQPPASAFGDYFHLTDHGWQARLRDVLAACVANATRGRVQS